MKNLNEIYEKCVKKLNAIGITPGNVVSVTPNTRRMTAWGLCRKSYGTCKIEISSILLDDSVADKSVETVMMHELLHTVDGCVGHGAEWKRLAAKVNAAYGYNVKRTNTPAEYGVNDVRVVGMKYKIQCVDCGTTAYRARKSNVTKDPNHYRCAICGGKLTVTEM